MSRPSIRWAVVAPCAVLCLASVTAARAGTLLPPAADRVLWLAADTGLTGTSTVTSWKDAGTGSEWVSTILSDPARSLLWFSGSGLHRAVAFDGNDGLDLVPSASVANMASLSLYIVASLNTTQNGRQIVSNYDEPGGSPRGWGLGISDGNNNRVKWFTAPPGDSVDNGDPSEVLLTNTRPYVLTGTFNGATFDKLLRIGDGTTSATYSANQGQAIAYGGNFPTIGALAYHGGHIQYLDGKVAEVLLYSSVDAGQRASVEAYLNQKYFAPAVASYDASTALISQYQGGAPYQDPNGVWSYGYRTQAQGFASTAITTSGMTFAQHGNGVFGWNGPAPYQSPFVAVNVTGGAVDPGYLAGNVLELGEMLLHPGLMADGVSTAPEEFAVVRWTAPLNGDVNIEAVFQRLWAATTDVHIVHNGVSLFDGSTATLAARDSFIISGLRLTVTAGDFIDFVVGAGGNGAGSDSTGFFATINYVPEPSSLVLAVLGTVGLVGGARLRRRR